MKKMFLTGLIISMMVLTSCEEVIDPENSRTEEIPGFIGTMEYADISEIKNNIDSALDQDFTHLKADKELNISIPDKVSRLTLTYHNDFFQYEEKLTELLMSDHKPFKMITTDEHLGSHGIMKSIDSNTEFFKFDDRGFMIWEKEYAAKCHLSNGETKAILSPDSDEEYCLKDGKMKASDAVKYAQELGDKYMAVIGKEGLAPRYVILREYSEGINYYEVEMREKSEYGLIGSFFSAFCDADTNIETGSIKEKVNSTPFGYIINVCTHNGAEGILKNESEYHIKEANDNDPQVISLKSALRYIDDNIGESINCSIVNIQYENTIYQCKNRKDNENGIEISNDYYTEPFWVIDLYDENTRTFYIAAIDCLTGEFLLGKRPASF